VSHTTCDRSPAATPAQKLATVSARVVVAPSVIACTASAAARPLTSLSGLTAVNQYSGEVIAAPTAASDQAFGPVPSSRRYNAAIARTPSVPATMLTRPSAVASDETAFCIAFAISTKTG